jgi:hypothetical protein
MKLNELLDRKVKYHVIEKELYKFATGAKIGGRTIVFEAMYDKAENQWTVQFEEFSEKDELGTFDVSGSGNELEVFSMIKGSMEEFIGRYTPDLVTFTASKKTGKTNRADLYTRLLNRFKIPGYKMIKQDSKVAADFKLVRNGYKDYYDDEAE